MEKLTTADDTTIKMVIEMLEVAVRNTQREIPNKLIDSAQVSAWGIYDAEKNIFEKA